MKFVVPRLLFRTPAPGPVLMSKGLKEGDGAVAHVAADQFAFAYCVAMSIGGNATGTWVPVVCA